MSAKRLTIPLVCLLALGCSDSPDDPSGEVAELFARSCAGATCHVAYSGAPAEDLDLSAGALCAELVGVPSVQASGETLVVPGDPGASYLLCKIDPGCADRAAGTSLMPVGSSGLDAASIELVSSWIADGVPGCAGGDEVAPEFAGAESATGLSQAVRLEWSPASDDTTPASAIVYEIHQAESAGAQDLATPDFVTAPGATTFTVGPLPISATRHYVVRARDASGNVDDNQVEVSATTLETADDTPPQFAGVESASASGSTGMTLSWSPASDDVTPPEQIAYRAYVATAPGAQDFAAASAESEPGATEMLVTGLSVDTTYYVVVRAIDAVGNEDLNEAELSAATAAGVSLSADVQPIFDTHCSGNACHGSTNPAEGLDLTAGASHANLVGEPASQCGNRLRVTAGDPGASYLINKLENVDLCSGTRMPKAGPLPARQIQLIRDWISEGAPDN